LKTDVLKAANELEPMILALERLVPLSYEDRAAIRDLTYRMEHREAGAKLVTQGQQAPDCCLLITAFAHKSKVSAQGETRIVAINLPGEVVNAESALHFDSDYEGLVFKEGEVAFIPAKAMRELLLDRSSIARAMWLRSHAEAAITREWLLNDVRRNLATRTAHIVCEIAARLQASRIGGADHFFVPVRIDELALALGSVRLYVERTLTEMQAMGWLRIEPEGLRILDWAALTRAADFDPLYLIEASGAFQN
jgi:CRP-like cAMP-binding protein